MARLEAHTPGVVPGMNERLYIPTGPRGHTIHGYHLPTHLSEGTRVDGPHFAALEPTQVHAALGWPARLFEIADPQPGLIGGSVSKFHVIEEHPGHLMLGPHGRAVQDVLDDLDVPDTDTDIVALSSQCHSFIGALREQGLPAAVSIIEQHTLGDICRAHRALATALGIDPDGGAKAMPMAGYMTVSDLDDLLKENLT